MVVDHEGLRPRRHPLGHRRVRGELVDEHVTRLGLRFVVEIGTRLPGGGRIGDLRIDVRRHPGGDEQVAQ